MSGADWTMLAAEAEAIAARLRARGERVAVAESSAGGLISAALLSVAGASTYYRGGGVIYTRRARQELLGLPEETFAEIRASTEDYAAILADAIRTKLKADWAIAESGATGPTGNAYGDPPGHSALAVAGPVSRRQTLRTGSDARVANMFVFAHEALKLLHASLRDA